MRREHALKNYWLQLISAAMDINMNLDKSLVFVEYTAHVETVQLRFFESDWKNRAESYDIWIWDIDNVLLSLMEGVAKGERNYRDLYVYVTENYFELGPLKKDRL